MLSVHLLRVCLVSAILISLAIASTAFWATSRDGALAQDYNGLAVDARPDTEPVDTSVTHPLGETFEVSVNITEVGTPYAGYQAKVQFDPDVLAYAEPPGVTYMGLGGMVLDATPVVGADYVFAGSARMSGTATETGQAHRIGFECIGEGTSPLHLVTLEEDPVNGSTTRAEGLPDLPITPTWLYDASVTCNAGAADSDGDGCTWEEEAYGAPPPKPGSTCAGPSECYSDGDWYDFYDVPVPANPDPTANGVRDQAVAMDDVLAVLFHVGAYDGDTGDPNPNGVTYDSVKGSCDADGDTAADKEGLCYDRSPGAVPNPPWEAGEPDGAVAMDDVLTVLAQVGLACGGLP